MTGPEVCRYYALELFVSAKVFEGFMGRFCEDCKETGCRHHLKKHGVEGEYFLAKLHAREEVLDG